MHSAVSESNKITRDVEQVESSVEQSAIVDKADEIPKEEEDTGNETDISEAMGDAEPNGQEVSVTSKEKDVNTLRIET